MAEMKNYGDTYFMVKVLKETKVEAIMQKKVVTVYEEDPLSSVPQSFVVHGLTHLIVVDAQEKITGIISQKYLYKTLSPRKIMPMLKYDSDKVIDGDCYYSKESLDGFRLKKVMKPNPPTLKANKSVMEAARLMAKRTLGCVPIVNDDDNVIGMITEHDIVKFLAKVVK